MAEKTYERIEVESSTCKGKFFWCGSCAGSKQHNYIRVDAPADPPIVCLYLKFNGRPGTGYTVRKNPDGSGFDFQHTVGGNQTTMFFAISNTDTTPDYKRVDVDTKFYLFSQDKRYRSDPIPLNQTCFQVGDVADCAICLGQLDHQELAVLTCGHSFHNACIIQTTKPEKCSGCARGFNIYKSYGLSDPVPEHYYELKCPVCRAFVI